MHENGMSDMRQEMADIKQTLTQLVRSLQQQSTLASNSSQQILPPLVIPAKSASVKPSRSSNARLEHRKKHRKDYSLQSDEDARYDQVPYEGLPLSTTAQLPSVSAITGRKNKQTPNI
jgi:hypothetical protein